MIHGGATSFIYRSIQAPWTQAVDHNIENISIMNINQLNPSAYVHIAEEYSDSMQDLPMGIPIESTKTSPQVSKTDSGFYLCGLNEMPSYNKKMPTDIESLYNKSMDAIFHPIIPTVERPETATYYNSSFYYRSEKGAFFELDTDLKDGKYLHTLQ